MGWRFELHDLANGTPSATTGVDGAHDARCRFVLRMGNGRAALTSEPFESASACIRAIDALRAEVALPDTWVRMRGAAGEWLVVVVNTERDVIARSPPFRSTSARAAAIVAMQSLVQDAPVIDRRRRPVPGRGFRGHGVRRPAGC